MGNYFAKTVNLLRVQYPDFQFNYSESQSFPGAYIVSVVMPDGEKVALRGPVSSSQALDFFELQTKSLVMENKLNKQIALLEKLTGKKVQLVEVSETILKSLEAFYNTQDEDKKKLLIKDLGDLTDKSEKQVRAALKKGKNVQGANKLLFEIE